MRIDKKEDIKKIKISHNKKLFWVIIFLIILLIFLLYIIVNIKQSEEKTNKDSGFECSEDKDCTKIQTSCCPCNMGGGEKCIPISEKKKYEEMLRECENIICTALYACNIESCSCINNKCVPSFK